MTQLPFFDDFSVPFDLDSWRSEGQRLFENDEALEVVQWQIGDWLLEAEDHGGMDEKQVKRHALKISKNRSWPTLKNYKSTSRKVPPSLRRDAVGYNVHRLVSPFSDEHKDRLLDKAAREQWTVGRMKDQIAREQKWGTLPRTGKKEVQPFQMIKMQITDIQYTKLEKLARAKLGKPSVADFIWWMAKEYYKEHRLELDPIVSPEPVIQALAN
jgi:hypothetical protein